MKNLLFIFLALGICSTGFCSASAEVKKYILTRDTKIPYLDKKEFLKLSTKEKKAFLAALRAGIVAIAEKPKSKYSLSFEFFKKAYANEAGEFCVDNTGHRQLASNCNPLPRQCRSGVQCAPIFGERICISPNSPIASCAEEYENHPQTTRNYFENLWRSIDKQNYMQQVQGLCNQGSSAANCEGLVGYLRRTGQQPILDAVIYSAPAGAAATRPVRQRSQASAEQEVRDSSVTPPQRRRNRQVIPRVSGSFPGASSSEESNTEADRIVGVDPNDLIGKDGSSETQSFDQAFARLGESSPVSTEVPGQVSNEQTSRVPEAELQDFAGTVRCSTGELTVNRKLRSPSDRQPFLSIEEVKGLFCERRQLTEVQIQNLRRRVDQYTSRFVQEGRSRSAARARAQTINQFKSILNNCISKNQRGEFPPGTPQVNMTCTSAGVCTVNGTPLGNGAGRGYSQAKMRRAQEYVNGQWVSKQVLGFSRATTSRGMIGSVVDESGWQWCQVSEGGRQQELQQRPAPSIRTAPSNS